MADSTVKQEDRGEETSQVDKQHTDTKTEETDEVRQQSAKKEEPQSTKADQKNAEPKDTKNSAETKDTKNSAEPKDTKDSAEAKDINDTQSGNETSKGDAQQQSQSEKSKTSDTSRVDEEATKGSENTNSQNSKETNKSSKESPRKGNEEDVNTKSKESPRKGAGEDVNKSPKETKSPSKGSESPRKGAGEDVNKTQKETKSPSKGSESNQKGTKKPSEAAPTTPRKDGAKKDVKGGNSQKLEKEGTEKDEEKRNGTKEKKTEKNEKKQNSNENSSGQDTARTSTGEAASEGRAKQKEFFKLELQRLETSLKRESSKITAPSKKPHTPYIFNTLEPYYNTQITRFLVELPEEIKHGHTSRQTAQGLTDPWIDLRMDRDILPKVASKPVSRQVAILKKEKEMRERKKRAAMTQSSSRGMEGSTRLPKFPMVQMETQNLSTRQLFYSDVPYLRNELKSKYSSSARGKIDDDYKRTQQDFYRMELDKLDEVHPVNRRHMKSAYFAYLQNTPGSKKAITDCVRNLESGKAQ